MAATLALGATATALAIALPPLSAAANVVAGLTALAATLAYLVAARRLPPGCRAPWWWLFGMVVLISVSLVAVGIQITAAGGGGGGSGQAAASGAMVLVLYGAGFVGLGLMVRRPRPGEGPIIWLDTALIFLAGTAVLSLLVIGPILDGSVPGSQGIFISLIYPVVDLALLALVARIAVGGIGRNPSLITLVGAFVVMLITDSLIITMTSGAPDAALQARLIHIWVLWCVLMALAVALPGSERVRAQRPPGDVSTPSAPWRLAVLGAAMLVGPILLIVAIITGDGAAVPLLVLVTVLAIVVALMRMRAVLRIADARAAGGVAAGEARERKRIERDLHDGLQQHLIAIQFRIGELEVTMDRDPAALREGMEALRGQAESALDDLRSLAQGIPPADLERAGVGPALAVVVAGLPVAVHVDDAMGARPDPHVETAAYFAALEGIQNQMKHGDATHGLRVRLATEGDVFTFSVGDARADVPSDPSRGSAAPPSVRARVERMGGRAVSLPDAHGGVVVVGAIPMGGRRP